MIHTDEFSFHFHLSFTPNANRWLLSKDIETYGTFLSCGNDLCISRVREDLELKYLGWHRPLEGLTGRK
jgi:hypothetical protein